MLKVRGERVFATVDRRSQEMPKLLFAGMGRCWRLKRGLHGLQQDLNFRGADGRWHGIHTYILAYYRYLSCKSELKPLVSPWCYSWCEHFDVRAKHYRWALRCQSWHKDVYTQMSCKPIEHIFGDLCRARVCSKPCRHPPSCAGMSWRKRGTWPWACQQDVEQKGEISSDLGSPWCYSWCDHFDVGAKHYRWALRCQSWHKDIYTQMSCKPIERIFGDLCRARVCSKPCRHPPSCAGMSWRKRGTWPWACQQDVEQKGEISSDLGSPWCYSWCQSQVSILGWNQSFLLSHLSGLASRLDLSPFPSGHSPKS